ncbi:unnamed protein product [Microthlaspi erraticum]|uniref:Helicase C-terminal domain-containing protein n=1 Tax=Microthlaspi erraticum TaxID=1685480 RepID=A0A6D2HY43_9BRAS|nr:unnamed protein product [Microthlaspi erraticum]
MLLEVDSSVDQAILFVNEASSTHKLHMFLNHMVWDVTNVQCFKMSEAAQENLVKEFKSCLTSVLITSDAFSTRIDFPHGNMVINFDLPQDTTSYLQRLSRVSRFEKKGAAFNLVLPNCLDYMTKLEKHFELKHKEIQPWNCIDSYKSAFKEARMGEGELYHIVLTFTSKTVANHQLWNSNYLHKI